MGVATPFMVFCVLAMGITVADAAPGRQTAVAACPSLASLRILIKRGRDDPGAAAAILADAKADHLGCILLERERIASIAERVGFNGSDYECLAIQGTSVCHWIIAGSLPVPAPKPPAAPAKPR